MKASFFTPVFKKIFKAKFYIAFALFCIINISGCKKIEADTNAYSALSVINASPTASTYDIYLSDSKINSVAIPFGGAVPYSQRVAGTYDLKFTIAGRADNIYTKTIGLVASTYQSFFLVGRTASLDGLLTTDDLSATSTTNAFVRFVNVSPDSQAMDLVVKGGSSVITNKAYKTASAFTPIAAGTYVFDVKETSTGTVKTSTESVVLGANVYYTVLVKGLNTPVAGSTELPLGAQVTVNTRL